VIQFDHAFLLLATQPEFSSWDFFWNSGCLTGMLYVRESQESPGQRITYRMGSSSENSTAITMATLTARLENEQYLYHKSY
jgi:hypothetical protein